MPDLPVKQVCGVLVVALDLFHQSVAHRVVQHPIRNRPTDAFELAPSAMNVDRMFVVAGEVNDFRLEIARCSRSKYAITSSHRPSRQRGNGAVAELVIVVIPASRLRRTPSRVTRDRERAGCLGASPSRRGILCP